MYQVPCPITDTSHLLLPNGRDFMVTILAADCDICTARSDAGLAGIVLDQLWLMLANARRRCVASAFSAGSRRSQSRKLEISGRSAVPAGAISQSPSPDPSLTRSQRYAEPRLQGFHLLSDGGRCHVQFVRRQLETEMSRRGFERAERIKRWEAVGHRRPVCHRYALALQ
jgi:hypothetical protein